MSLLSKIAKIAKPIAKVALGATPIGRAAVIAASVYSAARGASKIAGTAMQVVGPGGRALTKYAGPILRGAGRVAGAAATGAILYDAFGHPRKMRKDGKPFKLYRSINPMNHRALNRALKRVCAAKDISDRLNRIDIKKPPGSRKHKC